jgi:hypothetical protein
MHLYKPNPLNFSGWANPAGNGGLGMKTLALQLITVELDNGTQGVFVGWPLVMADTAIEDGQVENIWFSNIQDVPGNLTLEQLMELLRKQLCSCDATVQ